MFVLIVFWFGVFVLLGFSFGSLLFVFVLRWVGVCLFGRLVVSGLVVGRLVVGGLVVGGFVCVNVLICCYVFLLFLCYYEGVLVCVLGCCW